MSPDGHSVTFLLGAGASRGVSYASLGETPSPLDSDFFDLLQRLKPRSKDRKAVEWVLSEVAQLPWELRSSMERTFYTLHLRAYLKRKLVSKAPEDTSEEEQILANFARAIEALLRKAHGTRRCDYHSLLFQDLHPGDAIITFNYDLVIERAISRVAKQRKLKFGGWVYGCKHSLREDFDFPRILKLHGSSNWIVEGSEFRPREKSWDDFEKAPRYLGHKGKGFTYPIFLPFWDKEIEKEPWRTLWRSASRQLARTRILFVWGYSLPLTDVKARELLHISIPVDGAKVKLCVVDPCKDTRYRWRGLFRNAQFWEYGTIGDFFEYPPPWWWGQSGS